MSKKSKTEQVEERAAPKKGALSSRKLKDKADVDGES